MVARARELETEQLRFFTEIEPAARWLSDIDVMHSDGALQYTDNPVAKLSELCGLGARRMFWHRLFLSPIEPVKERQRSRLSDNGPQTAKVKRALVSYDRTSISEPEFLRRHQRYELQSRGPDWFHFHLKERAKSC
jgi:hypothetical protein